MRDVVILSEAGHNCTVLSPFGGRGVVVTLRGEIVPTTRTDVGTALGLWAFSTEPGRSYVLQAEEGAVGSTSVHR